MDLFFWTSLNTIRRSFKNPRLNVEDLPKLPKHLHPDNTPEAYQDLNLESNIGFLRSTVLAAGPIGIRMGLLALTSIASALATPVILEKLIAAIHAYGAGNATFTHVVSLGLGLVACTLIEVLAIQHFFYQALTSSQIGMNGINRRIVAKSLKLSRASRIQQPVGDTVNLLGTDSHTVAEYLWLMTEVTRSTLLLGLAIVLLWSYLGAATLGVVLTIICLIPVTRWIGQNFVQIDRRLLKQRDRRMSLLSQFLNGIRVLKYFVWQDQARKDIRKLRAREVNTFQQLIRFETLSVMMFASTSVLLSLVGFGTFLALGGELTATIVFPCLVIFSTLEHPLGHLTFHLAHISEGFVSASRLRRFLQLEEQEPPDQNYQIGAEKMLAVTNLNVAYEDAPDTPILQNIDLEVDPGAKVAVVGSVGAGKTTLLLSVLGEIPSQAGSSIRLGLPREQTVYVSQKAFIQSSSVKGNIAFEGKHAVSLEESLRLSQLNPDLEQLPAHWDTLLGEQGVNLSGGQKQRISIARAIAADPALILLDDPLSALDHETEKKIIEDLLCGAWKEKTILMVTHRLGHLEHFDQVVWLEEGVVRAQGTLRELLRNREFEAFYSDAVTKTQLRISDAEAAKSKLAKGHQVAADFDEHREYGAVGKRIFLEYFKLMLGQGGLFSKTGVALLLLCTTLLLAMLPVVQTAWLSAWMTHADPSVQKPETLELLFKDWIGDPSWNYIVLLSIGMLTIFSNLAQRLTWALRSLHAAESLFQKALRGVLNTKVRFFDTNPVGRILNRFSSDHDQMQNRLPWSFDGMIRNAVIVALTVSVILVVFPKILWVLFRLLSGSMGYKESIEGFTVKRTV